MRTERSTGVYTSFWVSWLLKRFCDWFTWASPDSQLFLTSLSLAKNSSSIHTAKSSVLASPCYPGWCRWSVSSGGQGKEKPEWPILSWFPETDFAFWNGKFPIPGNPEVSAHQGIEPSSVKLRCSTSFDLGGRGRKRKLKLAAKSVTFFFFAVVCKIDNDTDCCGVLSPLCRMGLLQYVFIWHPFWTIITFIYL